MFVFSSLFEGLGNVLLEALAFNMPIISTDCVAGPREILAPKTNLDKKTADIEYAEYGVLTPTLDQNHFEAKSELTEAENLFADAIINLNCDKKLRDTYRRTAQERIKCFDKNVIIEQWYMCINNSKE